MATVFRALDPNLDRYVAVKVLPSYYTEDPSFIGRFTQEAQTIARVSHPNILQIYDFGEDKGYTYIVSELIEGGDLQDRLSGHPMSLDEVLKFIRPLSEALNVAHQQGIVHRDLKPANVLIDKDDRAILADFGLARMLESSTRFTQESQALGTPEYMAPEQAMGADADHRSDLYALGIMVYQMLLGETPFRADTPAATLMAHVHKPLPLPTSVRPEIEPRLEATLLKALAKTPDDRFQSATEFVHALEVAGGRATAAAADSDDMGATAVLDTSAMTDDTDATLDATAVIDATAPPTPDTLPPTGPPKPAVRGAPVEAAPEVNRRWRFVGGGAWLYTGGAAAAVAAVAVIGAVVIIGGDSSTTADPLASNPEATASPVPEAAAGELLASAVPQPALSAGDLLEKLNKAAGIAKETVAALRGVSFTDDVQPDYRSLASLAEITQGFFRRDYLRQQVFEAEELYKALGLMEEGQDLEDVLYEIQLQTVRALFDEDTEKVYVLSDISDVGPLEELSIANAYMGAIQGQLFDTGELRRRARQAGSDQFRALNALIQGDVSQVSQGFITRQFSQADLEVLRAPLPDSKLLQAPDIVRKAALFPQREGANFVAEVYGSQDSWAGVDAAYADPPVSTEQILHPEKYIAGEKPRNSPAPDVSSKMGKGWTQASNDTMGEFILKTYLEQHLTEAEAATAAAGWGGDGYSLLNGPEGQRILLSVIRWDTTEDSKEFFDAYQVFAGVKMQGENVVSSRLGDNGRKWVTDEETIFVGQTGPGIVLIIGDEETAVGRALDLLFETLADSSP